MTTNHPDSPLSPVKRLQLRLPDLSDRLILLILLGASTISMVLSVILPVLLTGETADWWVGTLQGFGTEMFGAFVTFWLLNMIFETRQEKARLLRDLRSGINNAAKRATVELRENGWLTEKVLSGIRLDGANLRQVNLSYAVMPFASLRNAELHEADLSFCRCPQADLRGAILHGAKLPKAELEGCDAWESDWENASLEGCDFDHADLGHAKFHQTRLNNANLTQANLRDCDFEGADLSGAKLKNAICMGTSFQNAILQGVDFSGADLSRANLKGAFLYTAIFDGQTILPDQSPWQAGTDMARFTE
jgi:uncharacterized protein YjbI with pentapeptide repeats